MRHAAKRVVSLCVWLATAAVPSAAYAVDIVPSPRVRSNVVVRAQPLGPPSTPVGALQRGQTAELLESVPYFYKVRLSNGVVGWVSKSWTDEVQAAIASGELALHFIDVGQGDATLAICPNGSTILIDAGSTSGRSADEVRQYIVSQIEPHGMEIDTLIVSHPDADHYNLLQEVLDEIPIGRAYFVGKREDYSDEEVFDWLQETPLAKTALQATFFDPQVTPNSTIDCGPAKVWILAAAVEHPDSRKNAMSIVVMFRHGDFEAVVTGDATRATEDVIMTRYSPSWLDIDVLRVGHHGSLATSTSKQWADVLTAKTAIVSAGYDNSYGHPRKEVVDRLVVHTDSVAAHGFRQARLNPADTGPKYEFLETANFTEGVYSTATSRTVLVRTTGTGYTVTTKQ